MAKKVLALFLGLVSFFLMFAIGEPFGAAAAFIVIGIYYFVSQLLLSRGNARALYEDWSVIFFLNIVMIVTAATILLLEPDAKWTAIVVFISVGGSVLGAATAAFAAKGKR